MSTEQQWYYAVGGTSQGPVSQSDFDALIENGTIRRDTLVWREGMDDWLPLGQMPGAEAPLMPRPQMRRFEDESPARDDASTFLGALKDGFARYVDFGTRSNRPQFWFFWLWSLLFSLCASFLDNAIGTSSLEGGGLLSLLSGLAFLLPSIAVGVRRLHDTGRSGWWYLIILVPLIGVIVLIVFWCFKGEEAPNKWGRPV